MSPATIAFFRALGIVVLTAVLAFIGNQANISFLAPQYAVIISGLAVWLEGVVEGKTGNPLFGFAHRI